MTCIFCSGGTVAQAGSPTCTHLVVNEQEIKCVPFDLHGRIHIVKSEVNRGRDHFTDL